MADETAESRLVLRRREYLMSGGEMIVDHEPVIGSPPENFVRFTGVCRVTVQTTAGATRQERTEFPIPQADSLQAAVDAFTAAAEAHLQRLQERARLQSLRAGASAKPPPNLRAADG